VKSQDVSFTHARGYGNDIFATGSDGSVYYWDPETMADFKKMENPKKEKFWEVHVGRYISHELHW